MVSNSDKSGRQAGPKSSGKSGIPKVYGPAIDDQTRCIHYHSSLDIIAIRFRCCDRYYPCFSCHEETAGHSAIRWPRSEWDAKGVLCGSCGIELSINEYLTSANKCHHCHASFNPACAKHYHLYFEAD